MLFHYFKRGKQWTSIEDISEQQVAPLLDDVKRMVMKFSMNGFRGNLSNNVEELRDIVEKVLSEDFYEDEELKRCMNEVISNSNVLNCVFVKDDPEFIDMSHLEVKFLDDEDEH